MKALLTLALFGIGAFAAPVPKEVRKQSPRDQLQGDWVIVSLDEGSGQQVQTGVFEDFTLVIDGDKISTSTKGGQGWKNVTVVHDFSAKPMRMDVHDGLSVFAGIFKFEDGRLHWCKSQPGQPVPTEFQGSKGTYCFIWKRAEK